MIPLSRARPASITTFAIAFFASSLILYVERLLDLPYQQDVLQKVYPAVTWTRDAVIVWFSAWLSIAVIPIMMVWLSAIRFARWMVTFMAGAKLLVLVAVVSKESVPIGLISLAWLVSLALGLLAVAMLFTPASNRWFARKDVLSPEIFE